MGHYFLDKQYLYKLGQDFLDTVYKVLKKSVKNETKPWLKAQSKY